MSSTETEKVQKENVSQTTKSASEYLDIFVAFLFVFNEMVELVFGRLFKKNVLLQYFCLFFAFLAHAIDFVHITYFSILNMQKNYIYAYIYF